MKMRSRQRGVGLFTAIFLIVVLAALGTAVALIATSQQVSSARSLNLTRAYYAARAGIDEAVADARGGTCGTGTTTIDGIEVDWTCDDEQVNERGDTYVVYTIRATAVGGTKSSGTLVRRRLEVQATDN
ncbi:MAG: hypothetical protein ACOCP9_06295 [Halofilum sp. (in: g-proteobacteria)]